MKKGSWVYALTVVLSVLFIVLGYNMFKDFHVESADNMTFYQAKVISIDGYEESLDYANNIITTISFTARFDEGEQKGETITCIQEVGMVAAQDKRITQGDNIFIVYAENMRNGEIQWMFGGYNRVMPQIILCAAFLGFIILIGRTKGISTILSLVFTILAVFFVYVPSILSGFNVYLSTVATGAFIVLMSMLLINGADRKTLCAVLGTFGGALLAALLALLMNHIMKITGYVDEDAFFLSTLGGGGRTLNLLAIAWGSMVLGSIGAIMDVSMSIASPMYELYQHMTDRTFTKMFRSGMNIGQDAIGTMTNTLILAYIGGSLSLVLLLIVYSSNPLILFSTEMIAVSVVQAITGSMGILFAVPFSALFSAYIYCRQKD